MPIGPIINVLATLAGGFLGVVIGKYIPDKLRVKLPVTSGLVAFCLGVQMFMGVSHMISAVIAILAGVSIGELLDLEGRIQRIAWKVKGPVERIMGKRNHGEGDEFMAQFITVLVLFSASGLGIIGAMTESITGDYSVLLLKSILDFITAMIFGASLGIMVCIIPIPQAIILISLYYLGVLIMPIITPEMIANFSAVGGFILIATGFQITRIKEFSISNMLPALVIAMPIYALLV